MTLIANERVRGSLERIAETAAALTLAEYSGIVLVDGETPELAVSRGRHHATYDALLLGAESGVLRRVLDNDGPTQVTDVHALPVPRQRSRGRRPAGAGKARGAGGGGGQPTTPTAGLLGDRILSPECGDLCGALVVAAKRGDGTFSADDAAAVTVLADAAGAAIEQARIAARERRRQHWLSTSATVTSLLLKHVDPKEALREILRGGFRELCGADVCTVMCADPTRPTVPLIIAVDGFGMDDIPVTEMSPDSLTGRVLRTGDEIISADLSAVEGYNPPPPCARRLASMGPGMLLPLQAGDRILGVLQVGWHRGSPQGLAALEQGEQVELVRSFARQAALALLRLHSEEDRDQLLLLRERDRIGAELCGGMIERLSQSELDLHSALGLTRQPEVRSRLRSAVEAMEDSVRAMRETVFQTQEESDPDVASTAWQPLLDEIDSACAAAGLHPRLVLAGRLDRTSLARSVGGELAAAVQHSLALTPHLSPTAVEVCVEVTVDHLVLTVSDQAPPAAATIEAERISWLEERARERGGRVAVSQSEHNTRIEWHLST
ncbi:GAF domain-containing protein [Actinopolymorpha cephalotaxi]|uniref:GAF domain-containing protein n=1 Tax=Actinopolymorpha cephalotaxi TaxID=504797 RepID=A0A1I2VFM4_9ACTN|nr:GAF domain-containing protein [Actinopolymorpha cephalotaxi]NYH84876.1 signal transduction histidine kinase [Actinopolymorpha cephalotaxi]SFG88108.1 GAF domain-containing protein [Actinopolymorpha cephalotaxi]